MAAAGAHVMEGDPLLSVERRAVNAKKGPGLADEPRWRPRDGGRPPPVSRAPGRPRQEGSGPRRRAARDTHVMEAAPLLSVERRAVHAIKGQASADGPPRAKAVVEDIPALDHPVSEDGSGSAIGVVALITTNGSTSASKAEPEPLVSAVPDPPVTAEASTTPSEDAAAVASTPLAAKEAERPRHRPPSVAAHPARRRRWRGRRGPGRWDCSGIHRHPSGGLGQRSDDRRRPG